MAQKNRNPIYINEDKKDEPCPICGGRAEWTTQHWHEVQTGDSGEIEDFTCLEDECDI